MLNISEMSVEQEGEKTLKFPWFYNQHFPPHFTVGLTLRNLQIAKNLEEEIYMSKAWDLFV